MSEGLEALLDTSVVIDLEQLDEDDVPVALAGRHGEDFRPLICVVTLAEFYAYIYALVRATGRSPRTRLADLLIASVAAAHHLPLLTRNPDDFKGVGKHVRIVAV